MADRAEIPDVPPRFARVEDALPFLEAIEAANLAQAIHDELGELDQTGFPEASRGPVLENQPTGWTLFSGIDAQVATGLEETSSRTALVGAPWLEQPEGSPVIDRVERRGHMIFPTDTSYYEAAFAVFQAAALAGRVPDPAAAAVLREPPFQVALTAIGIYIPPEVAEGPRTDAIWFDGDGGKWLNMTAPMGIDAETRAVVAPGIVFRVPLTAPEMLLLAEYAGRANRPLPLLSKLAVSDLFERATTNGVSSIDKEA